MAMLYVTSILYIYGKWGKQKSLVWFVTTVRLKWYETERRKEGHNLTDLKKQIAISGYNSLLKDTVIFLLYLSVEHSYTSILFLFPTHLLWVLRAVTRTENNKNVCSQLKHLEYKLSMSSIFRLLLAHTVLR